MCCLSAPAFLSKIFSFTSRLCIRRTPVTVWTKQHPEPLGASSTQLKARWRAGTGCSGRMASHWHVTPGQQATHHALGMGSVAHPLVRDSLRLLVAPDFVCSTKTPACGFIERIRADNPVCFRQRLCTHHAHNPVRFRQRLCTHRNCGSQTQWLPRCLCRDLPCHHHVFKSLPSSAFARGVTRRLLALIASHRSAAQLVLLRH